MSGQVAFESIIAAWRTMATRSLKASQWGIS